MKFLTKKQNSCPICGGKNGVLEIKNATDINHNTVPGIWNFFRCVNCRCLYIDQVINENDLPMAYVDYPTHQYKGNPNFNLNRIADRIKAGYLWHKYGYLPGKGFGFYGLLMYFMPPYIRSEWDTFMMYIPKHKRNGKLLDVGCGSGNFLTRANSCGWETFGVDFDKASVANANNNGLNVVHGLIESINSDCLFDVITISHVIEHVASPENLIKESLRRLAPGGIISIATPNNEGFGIKKWKNLWSSLETPRHLVVFNKRSISFILSKSGANKFKFMNRGWHHFHVDTQSCKSNDIKPSIKSKKWFWHLIEIKSLIYAKNSDELHVLIYK
jgi:2-polyprenyl-3-methyl-5-hydroxy-6-metoxy-1,4-benzoquinol methylase